MAPTTYYQFYLEEHEQSIYSNHLESRRESVELAFHSWHESNSLLHEWHGCAEQPTGPTQSTAVETAAKCEWSNTVALQSGEGIDASASNEAIADKQ